MRFNVLVSSGRYKAIPEARENLVMDEPNPTLSPFKPSNEVPIKGSKNFSALFRKSVQGISTQYIKLWVCYSQSIELLFSFI